MLEDIGGKLFALEDHKAGKSQDQLNDLVQQTLLDLESRERGGMTGLPSGFDDLDQMLNGLHAGEMLIIAARPSMGKTAFMLNMAEHIALQGTPVGIFSLEMGRQQLAQRLLCSRSGVDSQKVRKNHLNMPHDFQRLQMAADELSRAPMIIDDTPGLTLQQMRTRGRRMKQQHDIQALFIDYLQLMSGGGRFSSRQEEVSALSRGVKALARELNVPIVCLSQLSRANESNGVRKPRMSDLRESGAIEQDADVIMMVHRDDYYKKDSIASGEEMATDEAEILVEKQRNGPTGVVRLHFDGGTTRFHNKAAGGY